jgi:5-methyltetrahydrofolate--homocysteine methyltransferase
MLIIGEKINSSIPSVYSAIEKKDAEFIRKLALDQAAAGAEIIDVNAGAFFDEEVELLPWLVEIAQSAVDLPLCIDSPNAVALANGLAIARRKAIVNSISLEKDRYESVLPLIQKSGASIIALCMGDKGIPATAEERFEAAKAVVARLTSDGIKLADIYVDVMAQPIGTDGCSGKATLDTVRMIKQEIPGVHMTCGLSNVSFGLPKRRLLNQSFAVALAVCGMDTFFIDPLDEKLMSLLLATDTIIGSDEYCCNYIQASRAGKLV